MAHANGTGVLTRRRLLGGLAASAGAGIAVPPTIRRTEFKPRDGRPAADRHRGAAHLPFPAQQSKRAALRRLEFRGGLVLTSPSRDFGGWSGLVMDAGGRSLLAVSDAGSWLTADIVYEGERPARMTNARLGPLLAARRPIP